MDNVLNRPLFRHREARDRLNDIAGVQRFQVGGDVRPEGLPSMLEIIQMGSLGRTTPMVGSVMSAPKEGENAAGVMAALNERLQDPNLRDNERRAVEKQRAALEFAINAGYGAADAVTDAAALLNYLGTRAIEYGVAPVVSMVSPSLGESIYDQIPMFDAGTEELARMGQAVPSNLRPSDIPRTVAFEAAGRGTPPLRPAASGMEAEARESRPRGGLLPTPVPTPESEFKGPSGMEQEARGRGPMTPALGPSGMEQEARGRGPLVTDPAAVAAGLNAEDPAVREKTVADFMQEFNALAPKYEGTDKNLMLAQIGFAIAAGESPNAMQNIANGLLAGSEAVVRDKAAKAEFDRQLQLSAMQYGLQEVGKQKARSEQALNFVALEDTVYKGRKVKAGESVYIPYGEIEKNGGVVPSGFGDSSMVTAINDRAKAMSEAIEKARQENLVDDTFAESQREKFSRAASTAISAERGLGYMESAILKVAEKGNIAGLAGAKDDLVAKVAAAAGLEDINQQFNNREEVQGLVRKAFQNLIPAALSGVQTANSISNRDIEILADAYVNSMLEDGIFSMSTITEDKLLNSMKGAVDLLESERQQSLMDMGTIEKTLVNRTLRSGAEATSIIEPYRELLPGRGATPQPRRLGSLVYGEDGIYEIVRPGN